MLVRLVAPKSALGRLVATTILVASFLVAPTVTSPVAVNPPSSARADTAATQPIGEPDLTPRATRLGWRDGFATMYSISGSQHPAWDARTLYRIAGYSTINTDYVDLGTLTACATGWCGTASAASTLPNLAVSIAGESSAARITYQGAAHGVTAAAFAYWSGGTASSIVFTDATGRQFRIAARRGASDFAALFPILLQGQASPPDLNITGGDDPTQVYAGQYSAVLGSAAAPAGTTCHGTCFSISGPSGVTGTLDASPELTVFTPTSGSAVPISQAGLAYAHGVPSAAPMMRIKLNGGYYAVPASSPAGAAIRADVYAPVVSTGDGAASLSTTDRTTLLQQTRNAPAALTPVSTAEYDYYAARNSAEAPLYYTRKDSYTDAELNAMTLVTVNAADPGSFIDNAQKNYKVITTGTTPLRYEPVNYSLAADLDVVGVGQGFAQSGATWIPVLVLQSADASIALVDLTRDSAMGVFSEAENGLLTARVPYTHSGQVETPLTGGARLTFVSTAQSSNVLSPAGQWIGSGTGSVLNLPGRGTLSVAHVAYGSYQQLDNGMPTPDAVPVVAAQLPDGSTYLFSAANGAVPDGAVTQLNAAFQPLFDRTTAIENQNEAAAMDTVATYQYAAVTAGIDPTRAKLLSALEAQAVEQNGVALPVLNGRTKLTATEAQQFFDGNAVKKAITDSFTSTEVLADLRRVIAQDAAISNDLATPVPGDAPRVVTPLGRAPQTALATDQTPATALQLAMGRSALAWLLDELAAGKTPPNNPALGGRIDQLKIRLAQDFPTSTDGDRSSALYVAYQLIGISNAQLVADTDPVLLRRAMDIRALLDGSTSAVYDSSTCRRDPASLSYLAAVQYRNCQTPRSSVAWNIWQQAPSPANGRTALASITFAPGNVETWRAAQQFTRAAFADFSSWAKPIAQLRDTMTAMDTAFRVGSGRLTDLDPALSAKFALTTVWQGVADNYTGVKFSDLSVQQLTNMFASVPAYLVGVARAAVRDTGLWTSVCADFYKVVDTANQESFVNFMVTLFKNKPIPVVDSGAITKAVAAGGGLTIPFISTVNRYGMFGTMSSLLAFAAMFVRLGQGTPTPQDVVAVGQNLVTALSTAPHYPRAIALIPGTFVGKDAPARLARMNSLLGLGNDMQTNITLLLDASNARINATMNSISAKFGNVEATSLAASEIADVLSASGWLPNSAATNMETLAERILADLPDGNLELALRRSATSTEDLATVGVRAILNGKSVRIRVIDGAVGIDNPLALANWLTRDNRWPESKVLQLIQGGDPKSIQQVVTALENFNADDVASDVLAFAGSSQDEAAVGRKILAAIEDAFPSNGGIIQRIPRFRWATVGRIVGVSLQALAALTDFGAGIFQIVLAAIQLADPTRTTLQTVEGSLNIAGGVFIMVAGILEIAGALIGTVVFLALFAIGVAITLIAFAITFIPDWERDQNSLTSWATPFQNAGLLTNPATAIAALVYWHRQSASALVPFPTCTTMSSGNTICSSAARTYGSSLQNVQTNYCFGTTDAVLAGGNRQLAVRLSCPARNMTVFEGMSGTKYLVIGPDPGSCLTAYPVAGFVNVQGRPCTGLDDDPGDGSGRQWTAVAFADGTYSYRNQSYSQCLTGSGLLAACDGTAGQRFKVTTP